MTGAFFRGFEKRADADTGGGGFAGAGKGQLGSGERDHFSGTLSGGEDTRTDKTLRDAERGPRDFNIADLGPEFTDDMGRIRY